MVAASGIYTRFHRFVIKGQSPFLLPTQNGRRIPGVVYHLKPMLFYVFFILIWREIVLYIKYGLIKVKLQLQSNNPNIQTKNKNDLKYFFILKL